MLLLLPRVNRRKYVVQPSLAPLYTPRGPHLSSIFLWPPRHCRFHCSTHTHGDVLALEKNFSSDENRAVICRQQLEPGDLYFAESLIVAACARAPNNDDIYKGCRRAA